ncbi:MAG: D-alanine--D-alanine ligase [Deltaproteobacteria bacterium]|nr:D-alanine--D-alanine ligase [Deltaproteobacteria bacterium]
MPGPRTIVGLTYDLRDDYLAEGYGEEETAEFDRPDTIEAIEGALRELGYETDRIGHARSLVSRLAAGHRWELVFNIAEGLNGYGREAVVPALLDTYGIPYTFSDPLTCALTLHKGMAKRVVRDVGIPTPDFALVETESYADGLELPFPLFAKPLAEGTGKGITAASKVRDRRELKAVCGRLLELFDQPVLVETFLPGREFTVGVLGTGTRAESVGVMEVLLRETAEPEVYSYVNKERCELLVDYRAARGELGDRVAACALAAWRALGCRDGGRVDVRCDAAGVPNFLEVNPLAGLHPEHSDLPIVCGFFGMPYRELIRRIVDEARLRTGARR